MIKSIRTVLVIMALSGTVVGTAACELLVLGTAATTGITAMLNGERVNLVEMNYAVADYLAGQTLHVLNKKTPIGVGPLSHAQEPEITSPFGRLITEQIGVRMAQLGYNVQMEDTNLFEGQKALEMQTPQVLLTGKYRPDNKDTDVNIRLVDLRSGQIIGSFDYVVPTTDEVRKLTMGEPRIMRIPSE